MESLCQTIFFLFHFPKNQTSITSPSTALFKLREQKSQLQKVQKAEKLLKFKSEGRLTVFLTELSGLLTQIYFLNFRSWLSEEILNGVQIVRNFGIQGVETGFDAETSRDSKDGGALKEDEGEGRELLSEKEVVGVSGDGFGGAGLSFRQTDIGHL